jgi:hypothetical protein
MNMESLVKWYCQKKIEVLEKDVFQCQFVHHKSHIDIRKSVALKMKPGGGFSEAWVFVYKTTRCHVTEDIIVLNKLTRHDRLESGKKQTIKDNWQKENKVVGYPPIIIKKCVL